MMDDAQANALAPCLSNNPNNVSDVIVTYERCGAAADAVWSPMRCGGLA